MEPWLKKLTSRKFLGAVLVIVTVFLNAAGVSGLETQELFALAATVSAFIFGESALDRERIKADMLNKLNGANFQTQQVTAQAQTLLVEKDALIAELRELYDAATVTEFNVNDVAEGLSFEPTSAS